MNERKDRLEEIRQKKLAQLKQQATQRQMRQQQEERQKAAKFQLMRKILSQKGRQRLENIRMVKPQFAQQIEMQLIQLYQAGRLKGAIPLAIRSAFMKFRQPASAGRKFSANVVFPAPFGPAMI